MPKVKTPRGRNNRTQRRRDSARETGRTREPTDVEGERELRLVLIGKTGSGKSASGNTILGRPHFLARPSSRSVTQVCSQGSAYLTWDDSDGGPAFGRRPGARTWVLAVDVPSFGDTNLDTEPLQNEIARCVALSAPGPHAFLLVVPIGRYTEDEDRAVEQMAGIFGEAAVRDHTVILFTRGDELEEGGIEEYLADPAPGLRALMERCGGRYHVLNNRDPSNRRQVRQLLGKVEAMVEGNGGGCYTNEMFLEAEAAIREEEERLLREQRERLTREERVLREERERLAREQRVVRMERSRLMREERRRLLRREGILDNILNRIKIFVAAAVTGLALGAAVGVLVPLAGAGGAWLMGSALASQLASTTVLGAGAAIGGAVGGVIGAINGLDADNVQDGVRNTVREFALASQLASTTVLGAGAAIGGAVGGVIGAINGLDAANVQYGVRNTVREIALASQLASTTVLGAGAAIGGAVGGVIGAINGLDAANVQYGVRNTVREIALASQLASTTVLGAGAAIGGAVGGVIDAINGLDADNVQDGVRNTVREISRLGSRLGSTGGAAVVQAVTGAPAGFLPFHGLF